MAGFKTYERIVKTNLTPSNARTRILRSGEANDCLDHSMELDERMKGMDYGSTLRYNPTVKNYNGMKPDYVVRLWFVPAYPVQANLQFEIYEEPDGGSLIYCWSLGDEYKGSMWNTVAQKANTILSSIPKTESKAKGTTVVSSNTATSNKGNSSSGVGCLLVVVVIGICLALLSTCS